MISFQTFPQPWFLSSSAKQNFESISWDSFLVAGCVQQQQHLREEGRDCSSSSASCWSTSLWSPVSSSGPHTRSASPSNHPRHSHCRLSSPSSTFTIVCSILKLNPSENHWKVFTKQFISISRSKSHKMLTYENRADQQQVTRRLQKYSSKLWVNHNPDLCSYFVLLHLWKRLWSFSSHWQKLFTTVTNNSQNRLLDGQTGERGAQAWKSQVSGIVQPLRCEMMQFETITKPDIHLDTVSSRPVAASNHCLEVLAKNLEIQKKMSISYQEPESAKEKEIQLNLLSQKSSNESVPSSVCVNDLLP